MISSMTGYGRAELTENNRKIIVEIKSVNHKYLDVNIKSPKKLNPFEADLRNLLKQFISRGKVDIFITYEDMSENSETLRYNPALAAEYLGIYKQISEELGTRDDISASVIARCPDVIVAEETEVAEEELWILLSAAASESFTAFSASRMREGEALKENILIKLDEMQDCVDFIREREPEIVTAYREKLSERVRELLGDENIDENRIAAEVVMFADKIAVDEEIVRLSTHITSMRGILNAGKEIGRNLDFLAQEMNRESNTILSKTNDIDITNRGIELKTCIEKIREQVQNIE